MPVFLFIGRNSNMPNDKINIDKFRSFAYNNEEKYKKHWELR